MEQSFSPRAKRKVKRKTSKRPIKVKKSKTLDKDSEGSDIDESILEKYKKGRDILIESDFSGVDEEEKS